jgi:hypothetical protein
MVSIVPDTIIYARVVAGDDGCATYILVNDDDLRAYAAQDGHTIAQISDRMCVEVITSTPEKFLAKHMPLWTRH